MLDTRPLAPIDVIAMPDGDGLLPAYARLRSEAPISWVATSRCWLLTRHSDVVAALRNSELKVQSIAMTWSRFHNRVGIDATDVLDFAHHMPFFMDGQRHTDFRRCLAGALAKVTNQFEEAGQRQVASLLNPVRRNGGFDLAGDFASSLFFNVMCDVLGFTGEIQAKLWNFRNLSYALEWNLSLPERRSVAEKLRQMHLMLVPIVIEERSRRSNPFLTMLLDHVPAQPDRSKEEAVARLLAIMLVVGNDPVAGAVAIGVRELLEGPSSDIPQAQWPGVSDDVLRFASTVDLIGRAPSRDMKIDGCHLSAGERVILSLLSASHDPQEFGAGAHRLSVSGKEVGPAFGAGNHLCIGMKTARRVVAQALSGLAQLPRLQPTGAARFGRGRTVRTISSYPVEFV
jgi:cytochrome P450